MENSKIEWCDHTFNPWEGCTKVSPGCANCYAEARNHRFGMDNWGKGKPRQRRSAAYWKQPLRWNWQGMAICPDCGAGLKSKLQKGSGSPLAIDMCECGSKRPPERLRRPRVFCASLADWLDDEVPIEWLADLLAVIFTTENLDYLLLTKRIEKCLPRLKLVAELEESKKPIFAHHMPAGRRAFPSVSKTIDDWIGGNPPANVWIGTTVENQEQANKRIPELLKIPAKVLFLSCEPLLGPVSPGFPSGSDTQNQKFPEGFASWPEPRKEAWFKDTARATYIARCYTGIHWVICGGESGPKAGPMHPDWARSLRDQCQAAGVPFFFKQWGEFSPVETVEESRSFKVGELKYFPDIGMTFAKIGKKASGRRLDGREWNEFPSISELTTNH